jgi:hypothetical protein
MPEQASSSPFAGGVHCPLMSRQDGGGATERSRGAGRCWALRAWVRFTLGGKPHHDEFSNNAQRRNSQNLNPALGVHIHQPTAQHYCTRGGTEPQLRQNTCTHTIQAHRRWRIACLHMAGERATERGTQRLNSHRSANLGENLCLLSDAYKLGRYIRGCTPCRRPGAGRASARSSACSHRAGGRNVNGLAGWACIVQWMRRGGVRPTRRARARAAAGA